MITIIVVLIVVGVVLWAIQALPMEATIKRIVTVLTILFACLYLLQALGLLNMPLHLR